jgi:hypothetical protein
VVERHETRTGERDRALGSRPAAGVARALDGRMAQVNAALPAPEREVLALLHGGRLDYAAVAELLGVSPAAVAELAGLARLRIARAGGARCSLDLDPACRAELVRQAARLDHEPADSSPDASCAACALRWTAMRAGDVAYRAWEPPSASASALRDRMPSFE